MSKPVDQSPESHPAPGQQSPAPALPKATHTPERWRAFESALQRGAWGIETLAEGDNDPIVAPTRGLNEETAKHLAHIKNSRDDLLAALEAFAGAFNPQTGAWELHNPERPCIVAMVAQAQTAIAKARVQ